MMAEIVAAIVLGTIGLIAYSYQERLKRRTTLAEKKQEIYIVLIENVIQLLGAKDAAQRSELLSKIEHAWLYASDSVLTNVYDYLKIYDENFIEGQSVLEALGDRSDLREQFELNLARIFLEMRREVRRDIVPTKIDQRWASERVKLYRWGIVTAGE